MIPRPVIATLAALVTMLLMLVYSAHLQELDKLTYLPMTMKAFTEPSPTATPLLDSRVAALETQVAALSRLLTPTPTPVPPTAARFWAMEPDVAWWKVYKSECPSGAGECNPTSTTSYMDIAAWMGKALIQEQAGQAITPPELVFPPTLWGTTELTADEASKMKAWPVGSAGFRFVNDSDNAWLVYLMARRMGNSGAPWFSQDLWQNFLNSVKNGFGPDHYDFILAQKANPSLSWFAFVLEKHPPS